MTANISIILVKMVKILLFKMTAEYKVATTELINTVVNKIRFGDIK
jgi:hypothetical protein